MKKFISFFESLKMTLVGGIALAVSLVMMLAGVEYPFDPAWITVFICGIPLLYLALTRLLFQRWVSSALLICIAMVACIFIGELFAAGEVAFIMAIGSLLEDYTVKRAKRGIGKLISLVPEKGRLVFMRDGKEIVETIPASQIKKGDVLRVLPGERVTVDGVIISGNTSVDQSIMTGESLPVDKKPGDEVFCGTMNCYGSVDIRAIKVGQDSSLQKMIELVKEAENKKAPMQRIVDKWATWLVPIAVLIAVATWLITGNLIRGVTVLVVFCPCALALATPVSIVAGIGQATKYGVLIKSGEALERMGKVDCITFDKTGTLTEGKLTVCDVISLDKTIGKEELLRLTASVENRSEHPLGKAIAGELATRGCKVYEISDFEMLPGKGVIAIVNGQRVVCGNTKLIEEEGMKMSDDTVKTLTDLRLQGKATIITAIDGSCAGIIALADTVRPDSKNVVRQLHEMGMEVVLLTGDNSFTAGNIASQIGISEIRADLLPGEKVTAIEQLQSDGLQVAMIGDGVNDAPALKTANVGIAMGGMGSDIAVESSDIALMSDDIAKIPYIKRLSDAVIRSIKVNITLSMAINFIAITLSFLGWLNPVTGALVHNAGSVLVVLNAALLYDRNIMKNKNK